jgi:hypothetical protein
MIRRQFVHACAALLIVTPLLAQAQGKEADPVSGTWTGGITLPGGSDAVPITLELKFDGTSAVTGTLTGLPNPGDVKSGTFDPKTGALKLQLGKTGEAAVLLTFDGTVVKGTASGKVTGEQSGEFKIAKKE